MPVRTDKIRPSWNPFPIHKPAKHITVYFCSVIECNKRAKYQWSGKEPNSDGYTIIYLCEDCEVTHQTFFDQSSLIAFFDLFPAVRFKLSGAVNVTIS